MTMTCGAEDIGCLLIGIAIGMAMGVIMLAAQHRRQLEREKKFRRYKAHG